MLKETLCMVLVLGCLGGPVAAMARETPIGPGRWWHLPQVSQKLELSEEQKQRLDELFVRSRRRLIDLRSELEKGRLDLEVLMDRDPLDEAAVMAQAGRTQSARTDLAMERFRYFLEVRKLLGVERFRRLRALHAVFKERMRTGSADKGGPENLQ